MWMFSFLVNWCLNRKREGRGQEEEGELKEEGEWEKGTEELQVEDEMNVCRNI